MSLVGDIILELRQRIPDAPGVLNPPNFISVSSTFYPGGVFLGGTTHYIYVTASGQWGETAYAPQSPMTVTLNPTDNALLVTVGISGTQYLQINVYETGTLGGIPLDKWVFTAAGPTAEYIVGIPNLPGSLIHANPTGRSTAFLPDSDGNFIGAYTAYRLLNRAISEMVKIAGGIVDVTGVQTTINQSMYRMASPFYTFTNAWFDGYPMDVVQRSMMYLRNSAAGFSGILSYEQDGPQQTIQVWPQSNRTGGSGTLAYMIGTTDTSFVVAYNNPNSSFLSIGLAQIDSEVVAYSNIQQIASPTPGYFLYQFNGVLRGMGGTDPATHGFEAPVSELNLRMSGYRMPRTYNVGDSAVTLMVPQAWETPLVLHMLSQVRSMEQDDATAQKLLSDFVAQAEKIAKGSRLGRVKPRQIAIWGQNTSDARNVNGIGFGWLIN